MTTTRMSLLFAAALGLAGPMAASAQTLPQTSDGPTIDETEGKPGTQSGPETSPQSGRAGDSTGSTGVAPGENVDQDTQSEDTGLQKQEGQPGTQSGTQSVTPPLAE